MATKQQRVELLKEVLSDPALLAQKGTGNSDDEHIQWAESTLKRVENDEATAEELGRLDEALELKVVQVQDEPLGLMTERVDQMLRMFEIPFRELYDRHNTAVNTRDVRVYDNGYQGPCTYWFIDIRNVGESDLTPLTLSDRDNFETGLWYLIVHTMGEEYVESDGSTRPLISVVTSEEGACGIEPSMEIYETKKEFEVEHGYHRSH